jgi:hypothetical protein
MYGDSLQCLFWTNAQTICLRWEHLQHPLPVMQKSQHAWLTRFYILYILQQFSFVLNSNFTLIFLRTQRKMHPKHISTALFSEITNSTVCHTNCPTYLKIIAAMHKHWIEKEISLYAVWMMIKSSNRIKGYSSFYHCYPYCILISSAIFSEPSYFLLSQLHSVSSSYYCMH